MNDYNKLQHTTWECKYHIVFIQKYRKKSLFGILRLDLGPIFRELARQKESKVEEGHMMRDHGRILLNIPPKNSFSNVVGLYEVVLNSILNRLGRFPIQTSGFAGGT